jgi:hypothetical protein
MAVKTIFIPLSFKYDPVHARMDKEYAEAMAAKAETERLKAEGELSELITEGYTLFSQSNIETGRGVQLALVLYKPDATTGETAEIRADFTLNNGESAPTLIVKMSGIGIHTTEQRFTGDQRLALLSLLNDCEYSHPSLKDHQRGSVRKAQEMVTRWVESDLNNFKQWLIRYADPDDLEFMITDLANLLPKKEQS